jgi:SAM-dependent methyltransferase
MTAATTPPGLAASCAFGLIAERYDDAFTRTTIGRAQRRVVWAAMERVFSSGDQVLELNCGTGEDALFLGRSGVCVTACDASAEMIAVARRRKSLEAPGAPVEFQVLANESLGELPSEGAFDGVLSNFSGLNCVSDLRDVAANLGKRIRPEGQALLCMSTRICLWEMGWYLARGDAMKAFRRVRGRTLARLEGVAVPVWYRTLRQVRDAFHPWFALRSVQAVGLFVPPSYLEPWAQSHPRLVGFLARMDRIVARWPALRGTGDHVLLEFVRTRS